MFSHALPPAISIVMQILYSASIAHHCGAECPPRGLGLADGDLDCQSNSGYQSNNSFQYLYRSRSDAKHVARSSDACMEIWLDFSEVDYYVEFFSTLTSWGENDVMPEQMPPPVIPVTCMGISGIPNKCIILGGYHLQFKRMMSLRFEVKPNFNHGFPQWPWW